MYYKFEEWIEKNKWPILITVIIIIYLTLFTSTNARFICNDDICRIEHYNATRKNIIKTVSVNLDSIQYFEIKEVRRRRGNRNSLRRNRYRYEYQIFAVTYDGESYNFFGNGSRSARRAQDTINYLNKELVKDSNRNINISFP